MEAAEAKGLKFKIGKRRFRIWKTGWETDKNGYGRVFFFWWHPNRPKQTKAEGE